MNKTNELDLIWKALADETAGPPGLFGDGPKKTTDIVDAFQR